MKKHLPIHLVVPKITSRIAYITTVLSEYFEDVDFIPIEPSSFNSDMVSIGYGLDDPERTMLALPSIGLLFNKDIVYRPREVRAVDGLPAYFFSEQWGTDLPFDLFAMVFHQLSRMEEYDDSIKKDEHGRYPGSLSFNVEEGFLRKPLVDLWIYRMISMLSAKAEISIAPKKVSFKPTIDIDMPFAFRYKGWKKYAGLIRDLAGGNLDTATSRLTSWLTDQDPFDTFKELQEVFSKLGKEALIFFLAHDHPPNDLNHVVKHQSWAQIIHKSKSFGKVGLHPSYASKHNDDQLKHEFDILSSYCGPIKHSRQHFIRLDFPETYHQISRLGITDDHSMIYPDIAGFRAATARPFLWYDLSKDSTTNLTIHPYAMMDVTLRYYENLSPEEAQIASTELNQTAEAVYSSAGWIWHNSSLKKAYGWYPWRKVFDHLMLL